MSFIYNTGQQFLQKDQDQFNHYGHYQTQQVKINNDWKHQQNNFSQIYFQSNEFIDNMKNQNFGKNPIYWASNYQNNSVVNEPNQAISYNIPSSNSSISDDNCNKSSASVNEIHESESSSPVMPYAMDNNNSLPTFPDVPLTKESNMVPISQNYFNGLMPFYQPSSPAVLDCNGQSLYQDAGQSGETTISADQSLKATKVSISYNKPITKQTYHQQTLGSLRSFSTVDQSILQPFMMSSLPRKSNSISAASSMGYCRKLQQPEEEAMNVQLDYNGRKPRQWRNRKYRCSHCNLTFYDRELASYADHIMQVERDHGSSGRRFKCTEPTCHWSKIGFVRKLEQQKHFIRKHGSPTFECRFWSPNGKEKYKGYRVCTTHWHADSGNRLRHERAVHRTVWSESLDRMEHLKTDL